MADTVINYGNATKQQAREGSPDKPSRPRNVWHIDSVTPINDANEQDRELFYLVQSVVGAWEKDDTTEDYETVYVPRPANWPPIQKVTLKYLDDEGSIKDEIRRDR